MTQEEIDRIQSEFAAEAQEIDYSYWKEHEDNIRGHLAAKKAVWEKYAALYPEWAAWSDELLRHAVG
jgi:hypothetical protein